MAGGARAYGRSRCGGRWCGSRRKRSQGIGYPTGQAGSRPEESVAVEQSTEDGAEAEEAVSEPEVEQEDEQQAESQLPKVAVLLCDCGGEIGGGINLQALADRALTWPEVGDARS